MGSRLADVLFLARSDGSAKGPPVHSQQDRTCAESSTPSPARAMLRRPVWAHGGSNIISGSIFVSKKDFEVYRRVGHRTVGGWLAPEVLAVTAVLDTAQRSKNISGAVAEIGVHHGKFFIGLNLLLRAGEHSVAIDVFGDQELNVDLSGKGDLPVFQKNVQRWSSIDSVSIHQGDSTKVQPEELRQLAGSGIRLFSVDGGHTESIVLSDMKLAEATLSPGGIVIADDVFNEEWPEVLMGTLRYLNEGGGLVPFALGFNKVLLSAPEYATYYRDTLRAHFEDRLLEWVKLASFAHHEVLVMGRVPRNRLREWHIYRN